MELCYGDGGDVRKSSFYVKVLFLHITGPSGLAILMGAGVSIYILMGRLFLLVRSRILLYAALAASCGCRFLLMGLLIRTCRGGTSNG